ncbi:hypothetical protein C0Z18_19520 [Trinickia dabaoshanensis]|uniref:Uncharacterized protein n=1 Tax=Trinickia dabaoshanensis TaxID=564714 RepID=A0A2N7VKI1_9BURK|nr:hypothetical protein [Trinickia dabaoshanensis]PMS17649.1 hypothetical protein C0Z18_19520 [Trinickia dabaoshanensis]
MNEPPRLQTCPRHRLECRIAGAAWWKRGLTFAVLAFAGCTALPPQQQGAAPQSAPQTQCVGAIEQPYGLTPISDPALLDGTVQPPGKGGLCMGQAYQVTQPLTVYRVWDSSKPWGEFGKWWSFTPPAGPRDAYRVANEICPSWSALDRVTQCRLKVGSEIVIGTGQSATCDPKDNASYPPSAQIQVFVPNDNSNPGKQLIFDCVAQAAWP